jgi:hypothetical protein
MRAQVISYHKEQAAAGTAAHPAAKVLVVQVLVQEVKLLQVSAILTEMVGIMPCPAACAGGLGRST